MPKTTEIHGSAYRAWEHTDEDHNLRVEARTLIERDRRDRRDFAFRLASIACHPDCHPDSALLTAEVRWEWLVRQAGSNERTMCAVLENERELRKYLDTPDVIDQVRLQAYWPESFAKSVVMARHEESDPVAAAILAVGAALLDELYEARRPKHVTPSAWRRERG